jgi:urate oxidase
MTQADVAVAILQGKFGDSYTKDDNKKVIATGFS